MAKFTPVGGSLFSEAFHKRFDRYPTNLEMIEAAERGPCQPTPEHIGALVEWFEAYVPPPKPAQIPYYVPAIPPHWTDADEEALNALTERKAAFEAEGLKRITEALMPAFHGNSVPLGIPETLRNHATAIYKALAPFVK